VSERTSTNEQLAAVIEALDGVKAPTTDEHLDALDRRLDIEPRGYAPAGRVRALYSRERTEANRQRGRADKAEAERDRYRAALEQIASVGSPLIETDSATLGHGFEQIAKDALDG
jgi:hypothetical protein